jgi:hypothetical protein
MVIQHKGVRNPLARADGHGHDRVPGIVSFDQKLETIAVARNTAHGKYELGLAAGLA